MSLKDQYNQLVSKASESNVAPSLMPPFSYPAETGWKELADLVKPDRWRSWQDPIPDEKLVRGGTWTKEGGSASILRYDGMLYAHILGPDGREYFRCFDPTSAPNIRAYLRTSPTTIPDKGIVNKFFKYFDDIDRRSDWERAAKEWRKKYAEWQRAQFTNSTAFGYPLIGSQQFVELGKECILFRDGAYYLLSSQASGRSMQDFLPYLKKLNGD